MTIDEAIKHCEEIAKEMREKSKIYKEHFLWERDAEDCQKCAEEHEQLAEWLKELKEYRNLFDSPKTASEILKQFMV